MSLDCLRITVTEQDSLFGRALISAIIGTIHGLKKLPDREQTEQLELLSIKVTMLLAVARTNDTKSMELIIDELVSETLTIFPELAALVKAKRSDPSCN